jgi:hypothetical protein
MAFTCRLFCDTILSESPDLSVFMPLGLVEVGLGALLLGFADEWLDDRLLLLFAGAGDRPLLATEESEPKLLLWTLLVGDLGFFDDIDSLDAFWLREGGSTSSTLNALLDAIRSSGARLLVLLLCSFLGGKLLFRTSTDFAPMATGGTSGATTFT